MKNRIFIIFGLFMLNSYCLAQQHIINNFGSHIYNIESGESKNNANYFVVQIVDSGIYNIHHKLIVGDSVLKFSVPGYFLTDTFKGFSYFDILNLNIVNNNDNKSWLITALKNKADPNSKVLLKLNLNERFEIISTEEMVDTDDMYLICGNNYNDSIHFGALYGYPSRRVTLFRYNSKNNILELDTINNIGLNLENVPYSIIGTSDTTLAFYSFTGFFYFHNFSSNITVKKSDFIVNYHPSLFINKYNSQIVNLQSGSLAILVFSDSSSIISSNIESIFDYPIFLKFSKSGDFENSFVIPSNFEELNLPEKSSLLVNKNLIYTLLFGYNANRYNPNIRLIDSTVIRLLIFNENGFIFLDKASWVPDFFIGRTQHFSNDSTKLILAGERWRIENQPDVFIKDFVVFEFNLDGSLVSEKTISSTKQSPLVYPNPANSGNPLNIVLPHGMVGQLQIQMVGLNGQMGKNFTQTVAPNQTELQLNLQGIAKGAYILSIVDERGEQFSVPVVVH